ncbi:MAG: hypothetical protein WBE92_05340 [Steroidobacteraceae bacterium]
MDSDSPLDSEITPWRLDELIRWHGTDESNLPPAHTLRHLARDTVAALEELQRSRERIDWLRAAMGRAFWAADLRELHAILLDALGPPPAERDDWPACDLSLPAGSESPRCAATGTPS